MRGYKVFNKNWTCRGFQYELGKTYEIDGKPVCCNQEFHYCKDLKDCFSYYLFNPNNKVAIVEALGDIDSEEDDSKHCTNKIRIVDELSWEEVLRLVNVGKTNSGRWNSGDWNSGDWNITSYSNGCFNTEEPKIFIFDKLSDMTYRDWVNSEVRYLLNNMPTDELIWVYESDMTDEEKEKNPTYKTTGGYLKSVKKTKEDKQKWFDNLPSYYKQLILDIPNFDAYIFEKITGIKTT